MELNNPNPESQIEKIQKELNCTTLQALCLYNKAKYNANGFGFSVTQEVNKIITEEKKRGVLG